jgi:type IV pilus assembly protein PilV
MVIIKNKDGFTLIEVMITMFVLSIGILAVTMMQIKATNGSSSAQSRTRANSIALTFLEELKRLPFDDVNLTGSAGADLDAGIAPAGGAPTPADAAHVYTAANLPFLTNMYQTSGTDILDTTGKVFQIFWNVDRSPVTIGTSTYTPFCTIKLFVYWNTPLGRNHVIITAIKYNNIKV